MSKLARKTFRTTGLLVLLLGISSVSHAQSTKKSSAATKTYKVQSLSVNGKLQKLTADQKKVQAQVSAAGNLPISGTLCSSDECKDFLKVIEDVQSGKVSGQSAYCTQVEKYLKIYDKSSILYSSLQSGYDQYCKKAASASTSSVAKALKNADLVSKDNQGKLDVSSGNIDIVLAPVAAAADDVVVQPITCPAGQYLGEGNKCYANPVNPCPAGQSMGEDKVCRVPVSKCPAGQAIAERSGKCEPIVPTTPRTE